jgi:protein transport protein SEC23
MNVGVSLLEAASPGSNSRGSRIVTLVGGAVTYGPGMIVSDDLKERIRSHLDMTKENDNAKYMKKAQKYYETLSARC